MHLPSFSDKVLIPSQKVNAGPKTRNPQLGQFDSFSGAGLDRSFLAAGLTSTGALWTELLYGELMRRQRAGRPTPLFTFLLFQYNRFVSILYLHFYVVSELAHTLISAFSPVCLNDQGLALLVASGATALPLVASALLVGGRGNNPSVPRLRLQPGWHIIMQDFPALRKVHII